MKCGKWSAMLAMIAFSAGQSAALTAADAGMRKTALLMPAGGAECTSTLCRQGRRIMPPGVLRKTSEKSRAIARRLDATGYYSRYSRALKGYPHLRSKKSTGSTSRVRRVNAENRKRFRPYVQEVARKYSLDPKLIDAVILVESAYDPKAVSRKGAMGLMQLMAGTAKRFDVSDPFNPQSNIQGGVRYLRWLMNRFDNDLELVLASYNAGEGAVAEHGGRIPPYQETRAYVKQVLSLYEQ